MSETSNIIPFDDPEERMRWLNEFLHAHSIEELRAIFRQGTNYRERLLVAAIALMITGREPTDQAISKLLKEDSCRLTPN